MTPPMMSSPNDSTRLNTSSGLRAFKPAMSSSTSWRIVRIEVLWPLSVSAGRDLLHDDVGLFFVRLEIRENGDIHTVVSAR